MQRIVIVISEFIERHSKAKHTRAPAYSQAMRRIKGVVQREARGKLKSNFQRVRGDRVAVKDSITFLCDRSWTESASE